MRRLVSAFVLVAASTAVAPPGAADEIATLALIAREQLRKAPASVRKQWLTPAGPGLHPLAARASRIKRGHPEGFHEAFANLYSDAAEAIVARMTGTEPDPLAMHFPNEQDGAIGVAFVDAAISSSRADGAWTAVDTEFGQATA